MAKPIKARTLAAARTNAQAAKSVDALTAWNRKLKEATRGLPVGFDLMETLGFEHAYIMPVIHSYDENNQLQRRTLHFDTPVVRSMQQTFRRSVITPTGMHETAPQKIEIPIPGNTLQGEHITQGFSSQDLLREIMHDPNWCVCYLIWPMTEADRAFADETVQSEEYQSMAERRRSLMNEVSELQAAEYAQVARV